MKAQYVWSIFAGCIVLGFLGFFIVSKAQCRGISCIRMDEGDRWKLADVYEEVPGSVFRGLYTHRETKEYVRIELRNQIEESVARDYIQGRIAGTKALYDNIRSPYPGLISNEIVCDADLKPTYTTVRSVGQVQIALITGFLNDRMTFGSCQKDQITYKGMKVLFSCSGRQELYDMEFIAPVASFPAERYETIIRSIQCR